MHRRDFVKTLGLSAAVLTAGYTATATGYAANETINIACIGTGGRCRRLMQSIPKIPGTRIVAVWEIWDSHRQEGQNLADPKAITSKSYHEVRVRKERAAVRIG